MYLSKIAGLFLIGVCFVSPVESRVLSERSFSTAEKLAIDRLREIFFAQERFKALRAVDVDLDGVGEHATLGELGSKVSLRNSNQTLAQFLGIRGQRFPFTKSLGKIDFHGWAEADGYRYVAYLPDFFADPIAEQAGGGISHRAVDTNECESWWAVYAWPVRTTRATSQTFVINQQGVIFMTTPSAGYEGNLHPQGASAYPTHDMMHPISIDGSFPSMDGFIWTALLD